MHELYIAESILGSVKASLPPGVQPESVTLVEVLVGRLDAVVPETLRFLFDAIKADKGYPRAVLHLTDELVECLCKDCSAEFQLDEPIFICPSCGSVKIQVVKGRGITLIRIEAEVEDEDEEET